MKDDKIMEKALRNIAQIMLLEELIEPITKAIDYCLPSNFLIKIFFVQKIKSNILKCSLLNFVKCNLVFIYLFIEPTATEGCELSYELAKCFYDYDPSVMHVTIILPVFS